MNRYFFYNTDKVDNHYGLIGDNRRVLVLLDENFAASGGDRKFGKQFGSLEIGDTLLMYQNETGVIGIGTVSETWDGKTHKTAKYYPNHAPDSREYRIAVDWDRELSLELLDTPITLAELRERFDSPKFTPRGALLIISKHHEAARQLVEELRSRHRSAPSIGRDIEETANRSDLDATTKGVLIEARIGQGRFRDDVLRLWNNRCAVTGSATGATRSPLSRA